MTRPTFTIYLLRLFLLPRMLLLGMSCKPHLAERRASEAMPGRLARPWRRAERSLTGACSHLSERRASEAVPGGRNFRHTSHTGHTYSAGHVMKASVHGGRHQPPGSGTRAWFAQGKNMTSGGEPQSISGRWRLLPSPPRRQGHGGWATRLQSHTLDAKSTGVCTVRPCDPVESHHGADVEGVGHHRHRHRSRSLGKGRGALAVTAMVALVLRSSQS